MDTELFKIVGQIAGIGGLALGVFLLLFRDIIAKNIFPQLKKDDAYRLMRLIAILIFLMSALGLIVWAWTGNSQPVVVGSLVESDCSSVNSGVMENAQVKVDC